MNHLYEKNQEETQSSQTEKKERPAPSPWLYPRPYLLDRKHLKGKSLNSQRKKAGAESKRMMSARFWNGKQIDEILAFSLLMSVQGEKEASSAETPS